MSSKKHSLNSPQKSEAKSDSAQTNLQSASTHEVELDTSSETVYYVKQLMNFFILLCCEDALLLYSVKSMIKVPLVISIVFSTFPHLHLPINRAALFLG